MFHLIDVSHHQNPASLDWAGMRKAGCDGCIVRLTYGTVHDKRAAEHIKRARDAGMAIGAYHFARCSQGIGDQIDAFATAARLAGYGRPEDLIPTLDVEDDTAARPITPANAEAFETMATLLDLGFGVKPSCYITQRDWGRLGKPEFVLKLPLHVAHYAAPSRIEPATPNGALWDIWQCSVRPFSIPVENGYDKERPLLDQNRSRRLRFLNGEMFDATLSRDEEFPAERHIEDTDRTHEKRARVLESILRGEASFHATEAYYDMLDQSRRDAHDELTGHDTDPSELSPESEKA